MKEDKKENQNKKEDENENIKIIEKRKNDDTMSNKININKNTDILEDDDEILKEIIKNIEKPKNKKTKNNHIEINLDNNIKIGFIPKDLITVYEIIKEPSLSLSDKAYQINQNFLLYEKLLKKNIKPVPIIKKFDKKEILINANYILNENLDIKDMISYNDNDEEIKNLERSFEKSIDKSFDKSYEKSFERSYNNNMSLNHSNLSESQNLTQNNNHSLSINDNSFNGSRSSIADIMSGRVIIQQLHTMFSNSLSENKEVEEENDNNELEEKEIGEDNIINQENEEEKDENTNDKNNNQNDNLENEEKSEDFQENE